MLLRHLAVVLVLILSCKGISAGIEWRVATNDPGSSCVPFQLAGDGTLGTSSCSGLPLERAVFSCLVTADGSEVPAPRILVAQQDNALVSSGGTSGLSPGPPPAAGVTPSPLSYAASGTNGSTATSNANTGGSAVSAGSGVSSSAGGVLEQMAAYLAAALPGRGVAVEQLSIDAFEAQLFGGEGWAANSSGVAGLPVSPLSTYLLADQLAPLGALLPRDARLQWSDFNAFFRTVAAVYDGEVISVPYTAEIPLLFYRTDVFAEHGLRPPATWHEYLYLAGQLHGRSMRTSPDSNSTIAGWCESFPTGCSYDGITLTSIWTSFVARQGPQAGAFFDPQTMSTRLAGAGMAESIRIFRDLHEFELDPHPPDCLRNSLELILQRCALFPAVSTLWKHAVLSGGDFLRGRLGVVRLPGSELVEHPGTGELVPCTQALCPYAELTDMQSPPPSAARFDLTLSPAAAPASAQAADNSSSGTGGGSASPRRSLLATRAGSRQSWVNFAPFLGRGAVSLGVSTRANPAWQYAAWRAISAALAPEAMWASLLDPRTAASPVRDSHMDAANIDRWVAAGYDRAAALGYLSAFRGVVLHPNAVMVPRIPGTERLGQLLADLSSVLQYNGSVSEVELVRALHADLQLALNTSDPVLRQRYRADIGYTRPASTEASAQPVVSNGLSAGAIAGIVVGTIAGTALLGVLCVLLGRGYTKYRSRLIIRMSSAPTYGHDTSLMITDIMESTKLWEQVDETVMDTSLDMHNRTIRLLLPRYGAYECHTEGDSFILAFHTAAEAVACALEIQAALLHLDWPEELLLADACRPVLALPPPSAASGPSPSATTRGGFFGGGGSRILAGAAAAVERMGVRSSSSRMSLDTALARAPGYGMASGMASPRGMGMGPGLGPDLGMSAHATRQLSGGVSSPYHISGSGTVTSACAGRRPSTAGGGLGGNSRQPSSNLCHVGSQGLLAVPNRSGDGRMGVAGGGTSGFARARTDDGDGQGSPQAASSNVSSATPRLVGRRRTHGDSETAQTHSYTNLDRNVYDASEDGSDLAVPTSPLAAGSPAVQLQLMAAQQHQLTRAQQGQFYYPNQPYLPQLHIQRGGPSIPSPIPEGRPSRRDLQLPASAMAAAAAEFGNSQGAGGGGGGGGGSGSGTPSRRTSSYGRSSNHSMWPAGANTGNWSGGLALTSAAGAALGLAAAPAVGGGAGASGNAAGSSGRWQAGSFTGPVAGIASAAPPLSRGGSTAASQWSRTTASASGTAGAADGSPRSGPGAAAAAAAALAVAAATTAPDGGGAHPDSRYLGGFPSEDAGCDPGPARTSHSLLPPPSPPPQQPPSPGGSAAVAASTAATKRPLPMHHSGPLPLHHLEPHMHPHTAPHYHPRLPPSLRRTADGNAACPRRIGSPDVAGKQPQLSSAGYDGSGGRLSAAGAGGAAGASGPLLTSGTGALSGALDNSSSGALQRLGHSGSVAVPYVPPFRGSAGPPPVLGAVAELGSMAEGDEGEEAEEGEEASGQAALHDGGRRRSIGGPSGLARLGEDNETAEPMSAPLDLFTTADRRPTPDGFQELCVAPPRSYRPHKPGAAASRAVAGGGDAAVPPAVRPRGGGRASASGTSQAGRADDPAAAAAAAGYSSPFALNGWLRAVFAQEMAAAAGASGSSGVSATGIDSTQGPNSNSAGPSLGIGSGDASAGNAGGALVSLRAAGTAGVNAGAASSAAAVGGAGSAVSWAGASLSLRHMPALRLSNSQRNAAHHHHLAQNASEVALMHAIIGAGTAGSALDSDARLSVLEDVDSGGGNVVRTGSGLRRELAAGNGSPAAAAAMEGAPAAPATGAALSALGRPPRPARRVPQQSAEVGPGMDTAAGAGGVGGADGGSADRLRELVVLEQDEEHDDGVAGSRMSAPPVPAPPSAHSPLQPLPPMPNDGGVAILSPLSQLTLRPHTINVRIQQQRNDATGQNAAAAADALVSSPRDGGRSSQLPAAAFLEGPHGAAPTNATSEQAHAASAHSQVPSEVTKEAVSSATPQPRWPPWRAFTMSGLPGPHTSSAAELLARRPGSSRTAAKSSINDPSALPSGLLRASSLLAKRIFGHGGSAAALATPAAPSSAGTGAGSPISLPQSPTGAGTGARVGSAGGAPAARATPHGLPLLLGMGQYADQAADSSGSATVLGGSGYPVRGTSGSALGIPAAPPAAAAPGVGQGAGDRLTERITSVLGALSPLPIGSSKQRSRRQRPSGGGAHPEAEVGLAAAILRCGPADRKTFRQSLLQLCYCQHATAAAVGGGAGRATVRHGSVTALLSPLAALAGGTGGTPPGSGARRGARALAVRDSVVTPELLAATGSAVPSPSGAHAMARLSPKGYSSNATGTGASSSRGGVATSSAEDSDRVTGTATGTSGDELPCATTSGRGSAASAGALAAMGAGGSVPRHVDARRDAGGRPLSTVSHRPAQHGPGAPSARGASAGRRAGSSGAVTSLALLPPGAAAAAGAGGSPGVGLSLGPMAPAAMVDVESDWVAVQCSSSFLGAQGTATPRTVTRPSSALATATSSLLPLPRESAAGKEGLAPPAQPTGAAVLGACGPGHSAALQDGPGAGSCDSSRGGARGNAHPPSSGAARAGSSSAFMQLVGRVRSLVTGSGGGDGEVRAGSRRETAQAPAEGEVEGRSPSHSRHTRNDGPSPPPSATRPGAAQRRSHLLPLELPAPDADVFEPRSSDPSPRAATPAAAAAVAAAAAATAAAAVAAKSFRRGKRPDATVAGAAAEAAGAAGLGGGNPDAPWLVPSGLDDPTGLLVRRAVSHTAAVNHLRGSRRMAALQRRIPYLEAAARAHTLGRPYQVGPSAAALAVAARGAMQPDAASVRQDEGLTAAPAALAPAPGFAAAAPSLLPAHGSSEAADGAPAWELGPDAAGGSGRASGRGSSRPTGSSSATAGAAAPSVSACGPGGSDDGSGTSTATTTHVMPAASGPSLPGGPGAAPPGSKRALGLGTALIAAADQVCGSTAPPSTSVKSQKLQPPPKLADAVLVRRRHSMASLATLWPGAYQNPLAAYGPAGPSRFLAAEVLHELTTAADTAAGLGAAPAAGGHGAAMPEVGNAGQDYLAGSEPSGWKAFSGALRGVLKMGGGGGGGSAHGGSRRGSVVRGPSFEVLRASGKLPGVATDTPLASGVDAVGSSSVQRSAMSMTQLRDAMRQGSFTAGGATAAAMVATGGAAARSAVFGTQVQAALLAQMQQQQQQASQAAGQPPPGSPQVSGRIASVGLGRYNRMTPHASSLASRTAPNNIVAAGPGPLAQPSPLAPASPRDMNMFVPKSRTSSGMGGGGAYPASLQAAGAAFPARTATTASGFQGPAASAAAAFAGAPHLQHSHSSRSHQSHNSVTSGAGTVLQRLLPTRRLSGTGLQQPHGSHGPVPLCFRGFRVRIGVSSGLAEGRDVIWVKASGRVAYSGHCMQLTKLVADAGMGGMVLLSGDAWERLQPWPEALTHAKALHCGRYELTDAKDTAGASFLMSAVMDDDGVAYWARGRSGGAARARAGFMKEVVTDVFQVTNSVLLPRLAHWEQHGCACGLRHGRRLVPGIMDAPLGRVTFVCVGVVGMPVLRAWDAACAAQSLGLWETAVLDTAVAWEGHPAAMSDGVALVAFHEPVFALAFVIALQASLREEVAWPEALLEHSLGEPLELPALRFRGLRTRATAETAEHVRFDVRAATSGALYINQVPKAIKRLQAMATRARMGQLLCRGGVAVELLRAAARAAAALGTPGGVQRLDSSTTAVTSSQAAGGGSLTAGGMSVPANRTMSMQSHTGSQGGRTTPRGSFGGLLSLGGGLSQRAFLSHRSILRGGAGGAGGATGMPPRSPSLANARASSATLGRRSQSSSDDDVLAELPQLLGPAPVVPLVPPAPLPAAAAEAAAGHLSAAGDPDVLVAAAVMGSGSGGGAVAVSSRSILAPGEEMRLTNSSAAADSGAAAAAAAAMGAGISTGGTGTVGATFGHNAVAAASPSCAAATAATASALLPHLHARAPSPQPHQHQHPQNAPYSATSPVEEIAHTSDSPHIGAAADVSLSLALARCTNRAALLAQLLQRVSILPLLEEAPQAKPKRAQAAPTGTALSQHAPPSRAATGDEGVDHVPGKPGFGRVNTGASEAPDGSGTVGAKVLEALMMHGGDSAARLPRVGEEGAGGPHAGGDGASDSGGGQDDGSRGRGHGGAGRRPTADAMAAAAGERMGAMRLGLPVLSAEGVKPNGVYLVVVRNAV